MSANAYNNAPAGNGGGGRSGGGGGGTGVQLPGGGGGGGGLSTSNNNAPPPANGTSRAPLPAGGSAGRPPGSTAPSRPPPSQPPSAGPSRTGSLAMDQAARERGPQPEIFRREHLLRAQQRAGTEQGVASGTDAQVGIYADRAVTLVMEDFARALVRTKDHRLHASYPRAPAVWSSAGAGAGGSRAPMWSLELADEPYLAHALLVAQQQRSEREERRKRKIRMTDLAARKALATATGGAAVGSQRGGATGAGPRDGSAAPRNSVVNDGGTATAAGSPADTTAPSPLPNAPANRGKTADEKAATKAQRDATKRAKDEGVAGSKKKPVKEPDVNAANRSMTTHLAGVGKKRTFAWMPDTEGGALGGTLNAKFSLGGSKKRKMGGGGVAPPIDMPWKPGGKAGLGKLGVGKAGAAGDASGGDGSRGATAGGRIDLGAEHGSIAHLVHGQDTAFPPLADTITGRDVKATLERFISRGGPTKQLFVRRWEEALLVIAREEQALAKHQAAEVTTVFKIPPCHPGDEKAMKQAEEAAENRAAAAAAAAATTAAGAAGAAGAGPL